MIVSGIIKDQTVQSSLKGRNRLRLLIFAFIVFFLMIAAKFSLLSLWRKPPEKKSTDVVFRIPRPNIVDRRGAILAGDLEVASLYAEPRKIIDIDEAVEALVAQIPALDAQELRKKLLKRNDFAWIKRQISPQEQQRVEALGLAGVGLRFEPLRVYPKGRLAAHVLGYVDVDSRGLAGIEKYLDDQGAIYKAFLEDPEKRTALPAELSLDTSVQYVVYSELSKAMEHFKAKAASGVVIDVRTGEVLALVSLPDFNPNDPKEALLKEHENRIAGGVFEMGSVVKALTFAMALDSGKATLESTYDARKPLVIGHSVINDYHAQRRVLTLPEVFTYSSNVGTAKMALDVGPEAHQAFLKKVGFFERLKTELPEAAFPLFPKRWSTISTVTAAFGHGIAIQPLQGAIAAAALVNGGFLIPPTLLRRDAETAHQLAKRIVSQKTSDTMRYLFRLNVEKGTATKANISGLRVGGKTGTAEKVVNGKYIAGRLLNSFVGAFPMEAPRYVVLFMLDEPQPLPETQGFATSGWNTVPTAGKIIERIAPFLGVEPELSQEEIEKLKKNEQKEVRPLVDEEQ